MTEGKLFILKFKYHQNYQLIIDYSNKPYPMYIRMCSMRLSHFQLFYQTFVSIPSIFVIPPTINISTTFESAWSVHLCFTWFYFTFICDSFFVGVLLVLHNCNMRLYRILCDFFILYAIFIHFNCISPFLCTLFMRFMLCLLLFNAYT